MTEKTLSTPIASGDLAELRVGDIVYLNGLLVTGRDDVYHRVVRQGLALPVELSGLALFHAGPIMRGVAGRTANSRCPAEGVAEKPEALERGGSVPLTNRWEVISIGPTTSMRMESCQAEFLETSGAKVIVGKGGMGPATAEACRRLEAIHTVFPGGCAVLAAARVEKVEAAHWLELGMSEAMWVLRVKDFGPLIVSIDTLGNNLFVENRRLFEERKNTVLEKLRPHLRFME